MKILLIYPPIENEISHISLKNVDKQRGFLPPLGLLYIASYLKKNKDFHVKVIDCNIDKLTHQNIDQVIKEEKPDIVGVSAMTHFLIDAYKVMTTVKQISKKIITVIGGPHSSIYPITSIHHPDVDYAIKGEGEEVFFQLMSAIKEGLPEDKISSISGLASKFLLEKGLKDEDIQLVRIKNLDSIPFPDRTMLPYDRYSSILSGSNNITTMITSRGCPFKCIFCDRMGKTFRSASPEYVLDEIESILSLGIKEIFIHDDTFTVNKKRVIKICQSIIDRKLKFKWDARARVDCVDYDLLLLMKRAGCNRVSFGVETGNADVLKNLRKGISIEQVEKVFKYCKELKLNVLADFMIGSPGETMTQINDSIKFFKKIKPNYVQFSIVCPYPDTDLYRLALSKGIITTDVWKKFAMNPDINFTPPVWDEFFSRNELEIIAKKMYRKFYFSPGFILNEIKKLKSLKELKTKIKAGFSLFQQ
ncbi:Radical SAM domain protein [Candidatus Magnetomorum sp. HK-1]|nr:Radical SAM domain protein [Candidatus Magnetomorum sp. HK-1]